jgi:hypothetical protein
VESALLVEAKEIFRKKYHLCYYVVDLDPNNYWPLFDLADTLLFLGENKKSLAKFTEAIKLIPEEKRQDELNSVLGPFRDYLTAGVLDPDISLKAQVGTIVKQLSSN